jgi:hypothetical protein
MPRLQITETGRVLGGLACLQEALRDCPVPGGTQRRYFLDRRRVFPVEVERERLRVRLAISRRPPTTGLPWMRT